MAYGKGKPNASSPGSGRLRRMLHLAAVRSIRLTGSAFGAYDHHLIAGYMKACDTLMVVMRKMLIVAYHLLRTQQTYDPQKIWLTLELDNF